MYTVSRIEDIKIAADTIGEAGIEKDLDISPDSFAEYLAHSDITVPERLHIHYVLTREDDFVHAFVEVQGRLRTACAACLSPVDYPIDLRLESDYLPAAPDMPDDLEAERQSPSVGYYQKVIPLGEYILSETVLSLPMRYLCRPECRGLCPQCGMNLNEGACTCRKHADPRFEKLAELKNKLRRE